MSSQLLVLCRKTLQVSTTVKCCMRRLSNVNRPSLPQSSQSVIGQVQGLRAANPQRCSSTNQRSLREIFRGLRRCSRVIRRAVYLRRVHFPVSFLRRPVPHTIVFPLRFTTSSPLLPSFLSLRPEASTREPANRCRVGLASGVFLGQQCSGATDSTLNSSVFSLVAARRALY